MSRSRFSCEKNIRWGQGMSVSSMINCFFSKKGINLWWKRLRKEDLSSLRLKKLVYKLFLKFIVRILSLQKWILRSLSKESKKNWRQSQIFILFMEKKFRYLVERFYFLSKNNGLSYFKIISISKSGVVLSRRKMFRIKSIGKKWELGSSHFFYTWGFNSKISKSS